MTVDNFSNNNAQDMCLRVAESVDDLTEDVPICEHLPISIHSSVYEILISCHSLVHLDEFTFSARSTARTRTNTCGEESNAFKFRVVSEM